MSGLEVALAGGAGGFAVEVAFSADAGVTALFGPSGAGKSTVLRMIAGTLAPRAGRIAAGGRVLYDSARGIDLAPHRRGIGFVFQDGRLFPHMSVRRNLTYARWAGRRGGGRPLAEVVALLGLGALLERRPATLSGGERQRVALGRALLADPALLLMDEPLSSLDRARRSDILPYLEAVRDQARIPIVYVSHETDEVARLADTVVLLQAGRVVAAGPAAELFARVDVSGPAGEAEAGALVAGIVETVDAAYGMARVALSGGAIEIPAAGLAPGRSVRLRVRAGDVALALERQSGLSIRNQLACRVIEIAGGPGPHALVSLALGRQRLLARLTRKSVDELGLAPGRPVVALVKAVSIAPPGAGRDAD
ncbi:molybdenum ABC transporter ATP-binding protein [Aquibium sp. A9E412]|uniref:molybdenum ABC transporter ATP-binding protein n=1 Tax=Aquibium sp. A9E412 TaxID=2976767 RepID=UPI0025B0D7BC|nr:molybdenum ABC transporter ATP-binding protein [Aquibium sp. A9E412]MDN2567281.1 molybdenum ABC transporter ATP-binding protein [Aquibium sp. A9E412]